VTEDTGSIPPADDWRSGLADGDQGGMPPEVVQHSTGAFPPDENWRHGVADDEPPLVIDTPPRPDVVEPPPATVDLGEFQKIVASYEHLKDMAFHSGWVTACGQLTNRFAADEQAGIEPSWPRVVAHLQDVFGHAPLTLEEGVGRAGGE
jgi:hypothetical protein